MIMRFRLRGRVVHRKYKVPAYPTVYNGRQGRIQRCTEKP